MLKTLFVSHRWRNVWMHLSNIKAANFANRLRYPSWHTRGYRVQNQRDFSLRTFESCALCLWSTRRGALYKLNVGLINCSDRIITVVQLHFPCILLWDFLISVLSSISPVEEYLCQNTISWWHPTAEDNSGALLNISRDRNDFPRNSFTPKMPHSENFWPIPTHFLLGATWWIWPLALLGCFLYRNSHVCLQVPSLIPVLLFKLGKEKNPGQAHAVLNCLPNLGTHKVLSTSGLHCPTLQWVYKFTIKL